MVSKRSEHGSLFDDSPRGLLELLLVGGAIVTTLAVAPALLAGLSGLGYVIKAHDARKRKRIHNSYQYLRRKKYIRTVPSNSGSRIELTKLGEKRARDVQRLRQLLLPIERPRAWDGRWRIILFDIPTEERVKRNAFRGFIKRLGAIMLQKSVWICPFECKEQVELLRSFFGFSAEELRIIVAESIEHDGELRKYFGI